MSTVTGTASKTVRVDVVSKPRRVPRPYGATKYEGECAQLWAYGFFAHLDLSRYGSRYFSLGFRDWGLVLNFGGSWT